MNGRESPDNAHQAVQEAALPELFLQPARGGTRLPPPPPARGALGEPLSSHAFVPARVLDGQRDGDRDGRLSGGGYLPGQLDQQGRITVVVCDELPVFARGLARLLEEESAKLRVTGVEVSLGRAKNLIAEKRPAVALLGLGTDRSAEFQVVREICAAFPKTRVVLLVSDADAAAACEALAGAGVAGYTVKHQDAAEIAQVVSLVARGHNVAPATAGLRAERRPELDSLDDTEREILRGVVRSETNRQLAGRLHMSERTISRKLEAIYAKLGLSDRLQAAVYAAVNGFVTPNDWHPVELLTRPIRACS